MRDTWFTIAHGTLEIIPNMVAAQILANSSLTEGGTIIQCAVSGEGTQSNQRVFYSSGCTAPP